MVGIGGGTASGKSTLCRKIEETIGVSATIIPFDSFYKGLTEKEKANV